MDEGAAHGGEQARLAANRRELLELDTLTKRIEDAEALVSSLKKQRRALQYRIADEFLSAGVQNVRMDGRTYYVAAERSMRRASGVSHAQACEGLRRAGLADMIRPDFSTTSLKAHVRELHEAMAPGTPFEEALPEELEGLFHVHEESVVRSRSSS